MASPNVSTPAGTYRYNGESAFQRLVREEQAAVDAKFQTAKASGKILDLTDSDDRSVDQKFKDAEASGEMMDLTTCSRLADFFEDSDDEDQELSEAEVAALPKDRQDYLKSLKASGHEDVYHRGNQTEDEWEPMGDPNWDPMDGDANRKRIQAASARVNGIIQQLQASSQVQEVPVAQVISSSSLDTAADHQEDEYVTADAQTKAPNSHSSEWYKRNLAEVNQDVVGATFGGGRLPSGRSMRIRTKRRRLTYSEWGQISK